MRKLLGWAGLVLWLLCALPAWATSPPPVAMSRVSIDAAVSRARVGLNEAFQLKVTIVSEGQGGAFEGGEPELPPLDGFEVLGSSSAQQVTMVNGQVRAAITITYQLMGVLPGRREIGPVTYRYQEPLNGRVAVLQSQPVEVDILPAYSTASWGQTGWWAGGAALFGLAAVTGYQIARRRTAPAPPAAPPPLPPLTDVEILQAARDAGEVERFYAILVERLRAYAVTRYGIPADTLAAGELISAMRGQHASPEAVWQVETLLEHANLARFAGYDPGLATMDEDLDLARAFLS